MEEQTASTVAVKPVNCPPRSPRSERKAFYPASGSNAARSQPLHEKRPGNAQESFSGIPLGAPIFRPGRIALLHETDPGNTIRSDLELLFDSGFGASAARWRLTKSWLN
jgi:hypothetical protein